jgi:hypothetical protein
VLTAQVGEALGAWGFTLEQTRELTPVLVGTDTAGAVRLLDRGVYQEDAQGPVVARASLAIRSLKSVHHRVAIAA